MIQRIKIIYHSKTKGLSFRKLGIKEWVKAKVEESIDDLVYKDDFSAVYCRNREKGVYVVYAHTHRDAQKTMRKLFINPQTPEAL